MNINKKLAIAIIVIFAIYVVIAIHAEYRLTMAQKDERAQTIEKYCLGLALKGNPNDTQLFLTNCYHRES